jgi:hypothetical protein
VTEKKGGSARRALQRGSRQVQPAAAIPAEGSTTRATRREGTKRITVDLPRTEHKFLRDFAYDNDTDGMRVVRALLMELADDPELSDKVLRRLTATDR